MPEIPGESPAAADPRSGAGAANADAPHAGVLSPIDRLTELLYGIILVLTFTGTLRVATRGGREVGVTLWAAVGCSLARPTCPQPAFPLRPDREGGPRQDGQEMDKYAGQRIRRPAKLLLELVELMGIEPMTS
jgi:hypothetical protein